MECGPLRVGGISFFDRKKEDKSNTTTKEDSNDEDESKQQKRDLTPKTVFLIRHAQSSENHRLGCLSSSISKLGRLSLPTTEEIITSFELIDVKGQIDSDVSAKGNKQILQLGEKLRKDNFLVENKIQLVAHSPLKRARQTSEGLLGCVTPRPDLKDVDSSWKGVKAEAVARIVELPSLMERTVYEWVPIQHDAFMKRIQEFESWLDNQPEQNIAIVGHSQYFKSMLDMSYKFDNCDVWQLTYTPQCSCNIFNDSSNDGDSKGNKNCFIKDEDVPYTNTDSSDGPNTNNVSQKLPRGWSKLTKLYSYDSEAE